MEEEMTVQLYLALPATHYCGRCGSEFFMGDYATGLSGCCGAPCWPLDVSTPIEARWVYATENACQHGLLLDDFHIE